MTISNRSLVATGTKGATLRILAETVEQKTFAPAAGGSPVVLAEGTLLAYNTSTNKWVPWATGGANGTGTIKGIVPPGFSVTIEASGGNDVIGAVMTEGEAWWEDLVSVGGETAAQIAAALQYPPSGDASLRALGIHILGLDKVR